MNEDLKKELNRAMDIVKLHEYMDELSQREVLYLCHQSYHTDRCPPPRGKAWQG